MNYLAHAWLSFDDPEVLLGNLISDFVKGKRKFDYPQGIQLGIHLHRLIDTFTNNHPVTRMAKEVFRPAYRLYSGAFVDVVYDHFLARDPVEFPGEELKTFSNEVYRTIEDYQQWLPEGFRRMFPYMKAQDWLYHYRERSGTIKSFGGVVRRAVYLTESDRAAELFDEHYQLLGDYYRQFWADLKPFAFGEFKSLKESGQL